MWLGFQQVLKHQFLAIPSLGQRGGMEGHLSHLLLESALQFAKLLRACDILSSVGS